MSSLLYLPSDLPFLVRHTASDQLESPALQAFDRGHSCHLDVEHESVSVGRDLCGDLRSWMEAPLGTR